MKIVLLLVAICVAVEAAKKGKGGSGDRPPAIPGRLLVRLCKEAEEKADDKRYKGLEDLELEILCEELKEKMESGSGFGKDKRPPPKDGSGSGSGDEDKREKGSGDAKGFLKKLCKEAAEKAEDKRSKGESDKDLEDIELLCEELKDKEGASGDRPPPKDGSGSGSGDRRPPQDKRERGRRPPSRDGSGSGSGVDRDGFGSGSGDDRRPPPRDDDKRGRGGKGGRRPPPKDGSGSGSGDDRRPPPRDGSGSGSGDDRRPPPRDGSGSGSGDDRRPPPRDDDKRGRGGKGGRRPAPKDGSGSGSGDDRRPPSRDGSGSGSGDDRRPPPRDGSGSGSGDDRRPPPRDDDKRGKGDEEFNPVKGLVKLCMMLAKLAEKEESSKDKRDWEAVIGGLVEVCMAAKDQITQDMESGSGDDKEAPPEKRMKGGKGGKDGAVGKPKKDDGEGFVIALMKYCGALAELAEEHASENKRDWSLIFEGVVDVCEGANALIEDAMKGATSRK